MVLVLVVQPSTKPSETFFSGLQYAAMPSIIDHRRKHLVRFEPPLSQIQAPIRAEARAGPRKALPIDAVYLSQHGAMASEHLMIRKGNCWHGSVAWWERMSRSTQASIGTLTRPPACSS